MIQVVVRLVDYGPHKIRAILALRRAYGIGLVEAHGFVSAAPVDLPPLARVKADAMMAELADCGATATLAHGTSDPTLDDVLNEYMASEEKPSHAALVRWIALYPRFEKELTDFTVAWSLQEALPPHPETPGAPPGVVIQARCHACPWQGPLSEARGAEKLPDGTFIQRPCPRCGGPMEVVPVTFRVVEPPPFVATDECPSCKWVGSWDGAVCPECGEDTRPLPQAGGSS